MDPDHRTEEAPIAGDPPNPINPPSGCRFHTRCKMAAPPCARGEPALHPASADRLVACHLANPDSGYPRLKPA
jgi:peptide/nickel transport system ATP-binding protein